MTNFVGFDPGGRGRFGWCVVRTPGGRDHVISGLCSSAPEALEAVRAILQGSVPAGIGIDAPLYWVEEGDRPSDQRVRALVLAAGGHGGTVSAVNSLRGACIAQGLIVGRLARALWPAVPITEAHPKALRRVHPPARDFEATVSVGSEHELDAALAAFSASQAFAPNPGWVDLRTRADSAVELIDDPAPVYRFPAV
jgi:hypothetical protein